MTEGIFHQVCASAGTEKLRGRAEGLELRQTSGFEDCRVLSHVAGSPAPL